VEDFLRPERVVIGSSSERAIVLLKDLYGAVPAAGEQGHRDGREELRVTKYARTPSSR